MHALATVADILRAAIFGDDILPIDEFDLLIDFCRCIANSECAVASGTAVEGVGDDDVELIFGEGDAGMFFVSFLGSDFSFSFAFWFARFNNIGGGWFGGIAGVFLRGGESRFELFDPVESGGELCFEFCNSLVLGGHGRMIIFCKSSGKSNSKKFRERVPAIYAITR